MNDPHILFKQFPTRELAQELETLLNQNGVATVLGDNAPPVDITFTNANPAHQTFEVRIRKSDLEKAREVVADQAKKFLQQPDEDHYLFAFSNEELYDVLMKPDEWNELDYALARQILEQRGKVVDQELLDSLRKKRISDLSKPEGHQRAWIWAGYFIALLGGAIGIAIGYSLWKSKKTLPNGERVYLFSKADRAHGQAIFWIGLIVFIVGGILYINYLN